MKNSLYNAIANISQSFYDKYVEVNARFRARSGVKTVIVRRELGKCCDWCSQLAGIYNYGEAPDDIYRRHDNCRCMVTVRYEKGTYEDVWSKKEYASQREARIARAKEINDADLRKNTSSKLIREYLSKATPGQGKFSIENGVSLKKEKNAIDYARIIHEKFGGDIKVLKTSDKPMPDYLWRGRYWEHKTFTSENSAYHQVKNGLKQISKKPGGLVMQRLPSDDPIDVLEDRMIRTIKKYAKDYDVNGLDILIFDNKKLIRVIRWP